MYDKTLSNAKKLYKLQMLRMEVLHTSHAKLSAAVQPRTGSSLSTRAKVAITTPDRLRKQVLSAKAKSLPVKSSELPSFAEEGRQQEFLTEYSSTSKRSTAIIDTMLKNELETLKNKDPDKLKEFFENAIESGQKSLDRAKQRKAAAKNKINKFDPEMHSEAHAKKAMKGYKAELKKAQSSYDVINKGKKRNIKYLMKMANSLNASQDIRIMLAIEEARQIGKNIQRNYDANSRKPVARKNFVKKSSHSR